MVPNTLLAYTALALLFVVAGLIDTNPKAVLDRYDQLIARRPEHALSYLHRGRAYLDFGNLGHPEQ
jgi:hypothetical protein